MVSGVAEEEGVLENPSNQHANLDHLPILSLVGDINCTIHAVCLGASLLQNPSMSAH